MANEDVGNYTKALKASENEDSGDPHEIANHFTNRQDNWLKTVFENEFTEQDKRRIAYMSVNKDLIYTKEGRQGDMLLNPKDNIHLMMAHRKDTVVPTTLWTEVNLILNFLCNNDMRDEFPEASCCVADE